ncbi:hypothetical protein A0J61_01111 [Choanephora cucurbitarum]|uniref:Uncharacterized protein n=1 Tax=Choanephora cucurbitarum TaxID=101091 RepID=A0A1C7NP00_9FUNG|nr:hypothetical protein A0J61_01113 [Choanephora cucurbitarum]OBZ90819.1 hypothetical protein A0J61_01111 [Choanephora cucurbitarum]
MDPQITQQQFTELPQRLQQLEVLTMQQRPAPQLSTNSQPSAETSQMMNPLFHLQSRDARPIYIWAPSPP